MSEGSPGVTVVVDDRIAERRREVRGARRRRRLRRTILALALLALVVAGGLIERSDLVALEEVRVTGTQRLDPAAVREAAALELGTSTLRLRLRAAERRVEELPLVDFADATRVDPLTVTIAVTERQPFAMVSAAGGPLLLDRDGLVIDHGRADDLPVLELAGPPPSVGDLVGDHTGLGAGFAILRGLPGPLRAEVARYRVAADGAVTLVLARGTEVAFGDAERIDEKSRALGAVLEDVGDTPVRVIDVRAPAAPTVRG